MKHLALGTLAASLLLAGSAIAAPVTYTLDPAHTQVIATWSHFGLSNPNAYFGDVDGTLVYDAADPTRSSVNVTLPLSGMHAFTAKFDQHLRSADFFDVEKFPAATFNSTKVETAGEGKLRVTGDLTLHGVTKPVVLDVTVNAVGEHPAAKVPAAGFDATATIKRSDFGVDLYAPNVSDEVQLRITTEATVPAPATK